jgi:surfactin synthase thioesterase subunit
MTFAVTALSHADPAAKPTRRYLLFPPAGAALTALRYLVGDASGVDVWGVEYPGRGRRIADPPPATLADLATRVARELVERWGSRAVARLALVGFSMGAFVALEAAWRLHALSGTAPAALVAVGAVAPQRRVPGRYARTDAGTLTRLLHRDGLVPGFRESPEVRDYAMELLRGDLRLASGYQGPSFSQVPCPVAALCGADDPSLDSLDDATEAWRTWTAGPFTSRVVDGGHLGLLAPGRGPEFWSWLCGLEETLIVPVACDA